MSFLSLNISGYVKDSQIPNLSLESLLKPGFKQYFSFFKSCKTYAQQGQTEPQE